MQEHFCLPVPVLRECFCHFASTKGKAENFGFRASCTAVRSVLVATTMELLVPMAGLEPARLAPLPPQDSVSTNSTTSAFNSFELFMRCKDRIFTSPTAY